MKKILIQWIKIVKKFIKTPNLTKAQEKYNTNNNFKFILDAYTKIKDFHENKNLNENLDIAKYFENEKTRQSYAIKK